MDKQRMVQRRRFGGAGLLIALSLLVFPPALFHEPGLWAQEGGSAEGKTAGDESSGEGTAGEEAPLPLEVRLETSPANPMVNNPWSIYVLVNYPSPSQVTVKPPRFPPSLILERIRTETRSVQGERWTRVEFLFTPQRTGTVTLDPFMVTVPDRQAETGGISVRFREEVKTVKRYDPRFKWASPVPSVPSGERGELFLELTNWDPSKDAPKGFFRGRAPTNAILEEGSLAEEGEGKFRYSINVIPLEESDLTLEAFSFQAEGYNLNVPEIKVPVLPVSSAGEPDSSQVRQAEAPSPDTMVDENSQDEIPRDDIPQDDTPQDIIPEISFTGNPEQVLPLLRGEYKRICAEVQTLWEENRRVEALAEIRRNERDSLSGPYLAPLRKEMEQALGLGFTEDESWRPLSISLPSWAILGFLIIFIPLLLLIFRPYRRILRNSVPRGVTSRRRSGFRTVIVLVFSIGLAVILLEEGLGNFLIGRLNSSRNAAVLEKTPGYRVPDIKGAVNVRFDEGQPVTVSDVSQDWCYAETSDGRFGWVPRGAVITY